MYSFLTTDPKRGMITSVPLRGHSALETIVRSRINTPMFLLIVAYREPMTLYSLKLSNLSGKWLKVR